MSRRANRPHADVCLILEGTYPYITGGVSGWTHDLLLAQSDLKFHLMTLLPPNAKLERKYTVPENVISVSDITIQGLPPGDSNFKDLSNVLGRLKASLLRLQARGGLGALAEVIQVIAPHRKELGRNSLLDSRAAWDMLIDMYRETLPRSSFLDFFWSWRALLGGIYSMLLAEIPDADVYHAVSTGYAGLMAARCRLEKKRPVLLTEHGIYTNERRIEMAMANWLYERPSESFQVERVDRTLKDLWVDTFLAYSHMCYEASSEIITLYEGNQQYQLQDGAPREKLKIVPNGIDLDRFSDVESDEKGPPTIALIGRVVPIKDVKSFIRACGILRRRIPDLDAMILGPTDEDKSYFQECQLLVSHLGLDEAVRRSRRSRGLHRIDRRGRSDQHQRSATACHSGSRCGWNTCSRNRCGGMSRNDSWRQRGIAQTGAGRRSYPTVESFSNCRSVVQVADRFRLVCEVFAEH